MEMERCTAYTCTFQLVRGVLVFDVVSGLQLFKGCSCAVGQRVGSVSLHSGRTLLSA